MRRFLAAAVALAAAVTLLWLAAAEEAPDVCPGPNCPQPAPPLVPPPAPQPDPKPSPPRKPWGPRWAPVGATVGGRDEGIACDLPGDRHRKNISSRGQGCCTHTSVGMSADWQNVPQLWGFADWVKAKGLPGGGYPGNMKERIAAISRERGMPEPAYLQVEGNDLEILRLACKTGRMPAVTYSYSPTGRYNGQKIAHMVNLVKADDAGFWVLDNNYPGDQNYEKLSPAEFSRVYAPGWAVILLNPPPPPPPHN